MNWKWATYTDFLSHTTPQRNEDCIVKEQDRVRALEKADAVENERSLAVAALSAAEDNIRVMKVGLATWDAGEMQPLLLFNICIWTYF